MSRSMLKDRQFLKTLVTLMLPMVAQNLITLAAQMMDSLMLGRLGQIELSASSLANQPFFIFNLLIFGMASGSSVLNAQFWGKQDVRSIKIVISICLKVALTISILLGAAVMLFPETVMRIYTDDPQIIAAGAQYLRIIGWCYFFFGLANTLLTTIRGNRLGIFTGMQHRFELPVDFRKLWISKTGYPRRRNCDGYCPNGGSSHRVGIYPSH